MVLIAHVEPGTRNSHERTEDKSSQIHEILASLQKRNEKHPSSNKIRPSYVWAQEQSPFSIVGGRTDRAMA
jgi:hypothetical protein